MTDIRIVHVGGTESDQRALEAILHNASFASVRSLTPAETLPEMLAQRVDLVVIDLMQPSRDVLALMRAAATAKGPDLAVPVIVTAPLEVQERITACLKRGADDYLVTPLDPEHPELVVCRLEHAVVRHNLVPSTRKALDETQKIMVASAPSPVAIKAPSGKDDQSYIHRFIPREFLEKLDRKSFADVKLGDHVEHEMTVFFSDIRDFTHLSESMSPAQNFSFLTSYLRNVTPIIRKNGGFVDKYLGDGVMALFAGAAIDAVRASVELLHQLKEYNLGRRVAGYVPIKVGMGLHRGKLMLGTIGAEDQMQTTVIADSVNVASRIEGMTKTFGVNLLLSSSVVDGLPAGHPFRLRGLGAVTAKGKSQSTEIFECFDNDPPELIAHKSLTAPQFARGMEEFRKGQLLTAGRIFARIAEMEKHDSVAVYFRDRCSLSVVRERGGGVWDGVEHLEVK